MDNQYTKGPWKYDEKRMAIVSIVDWFIPPDEVEGEKGIETSVVSLVGAMGGENVEADIRLMVASPDLLEALDQALTQINYLVGFLPQSEKEQTIKSTTLCRDKGEKAIKKALEG